MLNLALIGFLVGRRQMMAVLAIEAGYNLLNVALGLFLALQLDWGIAGIGWSSFAAEYAKLAILRSEEHPSELQSLMRISYAVFCLNIKNKNTHHSESNQ